MACNQYTPSTWFTPNSSQPDFTSNFTLGGWADLAWWGGTPYLVNQQENWSLLLGWFSDNNAGSALSNGHSNEVTSTEGWVFTYGYGANPRWTLVWTPHVNGDPCVYTALAMSWEIATDIDISSNQKFKVFAVNQTDPNNITTETSPGFLLLSSTVSSTSSSVSTAASHSSSDTSQTSPTPSDTHVTVASTSSATLGPNPSDLSSGAKVGIGVSCTLLACSILLGAFFFFMRRRRQQLACKIGPFSSRRPELDGRATGEKHELDEQHGISEMMEARITSPVEMPGDGCGSSPIVRGHQDD